MKIELQVNMNFNKKKIISGCGTREDETGDKTPCLFYANNIPHLLRKIKKTYDINQEDVTLTFQPN